MIICVDEEAGIAEVLLRCTCEQEIPLLDSYNVIEPRFYVAEKYDMADIVRALVTTPPTPYVSS